MAWTTTDLASLDAAIASGVLSVSTPDGKSVTYRSLDDMIRTRQAIADSLTSAANRQPASFVAGFKRDL